MRTKRQVTTNEQQDLLLEKSLRQGGRRKDKGTTQNVGRITSVITGSLGADALDVSIFAPKEQAERDRKVLLKLQETDGERFINRKNTPVAISAYDSRVVAALSHYISREIDVEDVKNIIENPDKKRTVTRTFLLGDLAKMIDGTRKREAKIKIYESIMKMDGYFQAFRTPTKIRVLPFLRVQQFDVDLSVEGRESVTIDFGAVFFYNIDRQFAYTTPQMFLAWRKNGRQTELYARLLFHLLYILTARKQSLFATISRIANEMKYTKLKGEERKEFQQSKRDEMEQAREEAARYEINVDHIKKKCPTDYDDRRTKGKFKKHFDAAVEGYKETGIILDGKLIKGKRGQQKAVFKLNLEHGANLLPI